MNFLHLFSKLEAIVPENSKNKMIYLPITEGYQLPMSHTFSRFALWKTLQILVIISGEYFSNNKVDRLHSSNFRRIGKISMRRNGESLQISVIWRRNEETPSHQSCEYHVLYGD